VLASHVKDHLASSSRCCIQRVQDPGLGPDASRTRTGNAPAVLATIRNAATTALRLAGAVSIAAARRTAALDPPTIIELFTRPPKRDKAPM
jgi:hypothetical protein